MNKQGFAAVALIVAACGFTAAAEPLPPNIAAAAADPARADLASADAVRHGPEIVAFAGVSTGAKVIDLIPGGGYWTGLFAASVGPSGHVYAIWPSEYVKVDGDEVGPYAKVAAKFPNVSVVEQPGAKLSAPEKVDLIFTAQNYHDYLDKFMGPIDPAVLNKAAFAALKPGGTYLIVDHVAEAGSGAPRHRYAPSYRPGDREDPGDRGGLPVRRREQAARQPGRRPCQEGLRSFDPGQDRPVHL